VGESPLSHQIAGTLDPQLHHNKNLVWHGVRFPVCLSVMKAAGTPGKKKLMCSI
jgi:hypothetical protein